MNGQRQVGWLVAGVAVIGFGAGCGGSSEPGTGAPADPLGSVAALNQVGTAFNTAPVLSLGALSNSINLGTLSAPVPSQTRAMLQAIRLSRQDLVSRPYGLNVARARQIRSLVPSLSASRTPIPGLQNNAGKTYEFNPVTGQYFSGNLTGAPVNGIRILLYAIDPLSGAIVTPLTQVGYVDLTDEGSGTTYALGVLVKGTGQTPVIYADYGVSVTPGSNAFTAGTRPSGPNYVTNGTARVDFSASISADGNSSQVSLSGSLTLNNPAVTVNTSASVNFSDPNAVVVVASFSFTHAGETGSLTLNATIDANSDLIAINAVFRINGRSFATITQTPGGQPVVTGPGGRQLTGEEQQYAEGVVIATGDVFDGIAGLADPGLEITGQDTSGLHL